VSSTPSPTADGSKARSVSNPDHHNQGIQAFEYLRKNIKQLCDDVAHHFVMIHHYSGFPHTSQSTTLSNETAAHQNQIPSTAHDTKLTNESNNINDRSYRNDLAHYLSPLTFSLASVLLFRHRCGSIVSIKKSTDNMNQTIPSTTSNLSTMKTVEDQIEFIFGLDETAELFQRVSNISTFQMVSIITDTLGLGLSFIRCDDLFQYQNQITSVLHRHSIHNMSGLNLFNDSPSPIQHHPEVSNDSVEQKSRSRSYSDMDMKSLRQQQLRALQKQQQQPQQQQQQAEEDNDNPVTSKKTLTTNFTGKFLSKIKFKMNQIEMKSNHPLHSQSTLHPHPSDVRVSYLIDYLTSLNDIANKRKNQLKTLINYEIKFNDLMKKHQHNHNHPFYSKVNAAVLLFIVIYIVTMSTRANRPHTTPYF
jgi:hypothetical protein